MRSTALLLALAFVIGGWISRAADGPDADGPNPLLDLPAETEPLPAPEPARAAGFDALFENASLTYGATYYGRARSADNRRRDARPDQNEIHVNALGQRLDLSSGYAWGMVGFDVSGQTNLGSGRGWSEVLRHGKENNKDYSSVFLAQAALKTRFGNDDMALETRGGWTPISVGVMGTSGGLFSHAYRGVETKFIFRDFWIGYGLADRFRNEWTDSYRPITNSWHQNRFGDGGKRISYVHSLGARYQFGLDKRGFADIGVGEGHGYRRSAQAVVSVPFDLGCWGELTLTGYGFAARYRDRLYREPGSRKTEYHVSSLAEWAAGRWTFLGGMGHTSAPDSKEEIQFRLAAWGNADNRNYIQTWGQLDDFVWDGQNVVKTGMRYNLGDKIGVDGLSLGATFLYSWNARNHRGGHKSTAWEADYSVEYRVAEGRLKGLALGVYAGHLRWANNKFEGKQNRNDVKVIISYARTLENFLRRRK